MSDCMLSPAEKVTEVCVFTCQGGKTECRGCEFKSLIYSLLCNNLEILTQDNSSKDIDKSQALWARPVVSPPPLFDLIGFQPLQCIHAAHWSPSTSEGTNQHAVLPVKRAHRQSWTCSQTERLVGLFCHIKSSFSLQRFDFPLQSRVIPLSVVLVKRLILNKPFTAKLWSLKTELISRWVTRRPQLLTCLSSGLYPGPWCRSGCDPGHCWERLLYHEL